MNQYVYGALNLVHPASAYFVVKKNVEKSGFKVEIVSGF